MESIKLASYLFSLLTFLAGLILGHRLSLGRDKRKEFNEISIPINIALKAQLHNIAAGSFNHDLVSNSELIGLGLHVGKLKKSAYDRAVAAYSSCFERSGHVNDRGVWEFDDISICKEATTKMLTYAIVK